MHEKEDASVRHFLRSRARRIVLNTVKTSQFDAEGIGEVDIEIYSQPAWIKFRKTCPHKIKRSLQYGDRERSGRLLDVPTVLNPIRWMFALLASGAGHPRPVHAISLQSVPGLMTRGRLSKLNLTYPTRGGDGNRVAALRLVGSPSVLLLTSMGRRCVLLQQTLLAFSLPMHLMNSGLAANVG